MSLNKRLKRLEAKLPPEKKVIVVKFGNQIHQLKFGELIFNRDEDETESDFIKRAKAVVEATPDRPLVSILLGNF